MISGRIWPVAWIDRNGQGKHRSLAQNPSGLVSTAASLYAAALYPENVKSLEYAFDAARTRKGYGERVEDLNFYLGDKPGWGVKVEY